MVFDKNTMLPSPNTILFGVFCCALTLRGGTAKEGWLTAVLGARQWLRGGSSLQSSCSLTSQGNGVAGEAPSTLSSLATLTKDVVTSSWHILAHSLPKIAPYVDLLPSDLIFSEHKWPGFVLGLQARLQPLPFCNSNKPYCKCLAWSIWQLYLPWFTSVSHWGLIIVLELINIAQCPAMTPPQRTSVWLGRTS